MNCLSSLSGLSYTKKGIPSRISKSLYVFLTFWVFSASCTHWAYDCNLRANLIKKDYEIIPHSLQDVLDMNYEFHVPVGGSEFANTFSKSTLASRKEIYRRAMLLRKKYKLQGTASIDRTFATESEERKLNAHFILQMAEIKSF